MVEDWKKNAFPGLTWLDEANHLQSALDAVKFHDPFAELRKSIDALRPHDFMTDVQKWMTPAVDFAAEARSLLEAYQIPSFSEELKKFDAAVGNSAFTNFNTALLGQTESVFEQWRHAVESISREQTLGVSDLLTVSTQTYQSIFGKGAMLADSIGRVAPIFWSTKFDDPEEFLNILEDATEDVERRIGESRVHAVSLEFYLSFLITLLLFVWQLKLSDEGERRVTARIAAVEASLTTRLLARETFQEVESLAFARRPASVRKGPRSRSDKVATVYPNTPIHVIRIRREWVLVEFFDHATGVHLSGWCLKKYLQLPRGIRSEIETEYLLSTPVNADRLAAAVNSARARDVEPRSLHAIQKELLGDKK